jgi:GntR family transcriptional regulator
MPDPIWRRIAEDLRVKIENGELGSSGQPLPSELELRAEYKASRNTVRDAVKWLMSRGLVETRPGQGTYVVQAIDPFVTSLTAEHSPGVSQTTSYASEVAASGGRKATVSVPRIEVQTPTGVVADQLGLTDTDSVVIRHQQRYIDDIPWSLQTTHYPMSFVERGATDLLVPQDKPDGVVHYLGEKLGIRQTGWTDIMQVRAPDSVESAFFGLPDDGRVAVIEIRRTAFDHDKKPFRITITTYPADRNQFTVTVMDNTEGVSESAESG